MTSENSHHARRRGLADPPAPRRPLVVTSEPVLLDELLRLCGAAGPPPVVATDPEALRRAWAAASVVLLGAELAATARELPHRSHVVVVGSETDPLWQLAADVGADHVAVLPGAAPWLVGLLSESQPAASRAPLVAVMGGQGGAGATTLAAALSRQAAGEGLFTLLVDVDPFGGGIDLAMGMETAAGERWPQLLSDWQDREGTPAALVARLPGRGNLRLLSVDRDEPIVLPREAVARALAAGRSSCELVVVDLPRQFDAVTREALAAADCLYLVVPAQVRAVAAAAQLATALRDHTAVVQAVIRGPAPSSLPLSTMQRSLGIPVAGAVRAEPGLARDYERGIPPGQPRGPLARLCAELLVQLRDSHPRRGSTDALPAA